jgi:hypothetical protein
VVIDDQKHGNAVSVSLYGDVNESCLCEKLLRFVPEEATKLVGNSNAELRGGRGLLPFLGSPTHSHILSCSLPRKCRGAPPSRRSGRVQAYPRGMAVSAERVRWLLRLRGKIEQVTRPIVHLDETELRLRVDRVFARRRGGRL